MTSAKSPIIASYLALLMTAAENNYGKTFFRMVSEFSVTI